MLVQGETGPMGVVLVVYGGGSVGSAIVVGVEVDFLAASAATRALLRSVAVKATLMNLYILNRLIGKVNDDQWVSTERRL